MKFEQIKKPTSKLTKGFVGLFAIKLFFILIVFVVQSCKKDNLTQSKNQLKAKENFLNSINGSLKSLDKLTLQSKTSSAIKVNSDVNAYQNDYATISLYSESGYTSSYSSTNSNIFFGSLFDIPNTEIGITNSEGVQTNNITPDQQFILSYDMSSQVAEEIMQPSLLEAKNYFYAQGYSELDIQELLAADVDGPALDESSLVPAVMMLIAEEQNLSASKSFNIQSMFGYEAKASEIGTCAGDRCISNSWRTSRWSRNISG